MRLSNCYSSVKKSGFFLCQSNCALCYDWHSLLQDTDRKDDSHKKVEECLTVTPLHTGGGERRQSQDSVGGGGVGPHHHSSPDSSPEVNVTCNNQPDLIDDHTSHMIDRHGDLEEEEDIPEPEDVEVGTTSLTCFLNVGQVYFIPEVIKL